MSNDILLIVFGAICALLAFIEINAITDREKHRRFCEDHAKRLEESNRAHTEAVERHAKAMAAYQAFMETR